MGTDMDLTNNSTVSKLLLLYVCDKIDMPLTEDTITEMCCFRNNWLSFITCKEVIAELLDTSFLIATTKPNTKTFYSITADGRSCLNYFFMKIPNSLREEIVAYIKKNRMDFKRKQEYIADYFQNLDGTYTVLMRIIDTTGIKFEVKTIVDNRATARTMYKKWEEKAGNVYASMYDILVD